MMPLCSPMLLKPPAGAGGNISFVGSMSWSHNLGTPQVVALSGLRNELGVAPTLLQNDILVATVQREENSATTEAETLCTGFTAFHAPIFVNSGGGLNFLMQYKVMGLSPDTTVTVPQVNSGYRVTCGSFHVLRGVNTSSPLDVAAVLNSGTGTGVADGSAITPATTGAWIMIGGAAVNGNGNIAALTNPANLSATTNHFAVAQRAGDSTATAATAGAGLKTDWASGAFDPAAFGGGMGASAYAKWAAVSLALRPGA